MTNSTGLDASKTVIADLGKMSRKRIRRLKKGEGKGWDEVGKAVAAISADGGSADVIVVLVQRRKRRRKGSRIPFLPF